MSRSHFHQALGAVLLFLSVVPAWAADAIPARGEERAVVFPAGSAALVPRVQGALLALVQEMGPEAQVTVVGRDDDGASEALAQERAKILGAALRAAGVARARITVRHELAPAGVGAAPSAIRWSVARDVATAAPSVAPELAIAAPLPSPTFAPAPAPAAVVAVPPAAAPVPAPTTVAAAPPAPTSSKELAIEAPAAGRVEAPVSVPAPAPVRPRPQAAKRFDILVADGDLATTLSRWGMAHGYTVVWEAPMKPAVTGELTLDAATFPDAVAQVMFGLQGAGYPVRAHQYADKVIRITAAAPER
jgi:hypothetical protein